MSDAVVDAVTNTDAAAAPPPDLPAQAGVPQEPSSPASDPRPAETPVITEPPIEAPEHVEAPTTPTPAEVPAQASPEAPQAPAVPVQITIKDRLYAAIEKIRFNKRKKLDKIVQLAIHKGRIKNDDVQIAVRVSHATATNYLNELVRSGRLKRVGDSHQPTYEPL